MKEKVIARTIKIDFDIEAIVKSIIDSYQETVFGYQKYLKEQEENIISIFACNGNKNIRSLKKALFEFERLFEQFKEKSYIKNDKFDEIFNGFIILKMENDLNNIQIGCPLGFVEFKNKSTIQKYINIEKNIQIFSINNWIINSEFRFEDIINEVEISCIPKKFSPQKRFLYAHILHLEDDEAKEGLNAALLDAYNGKLMIDEYRRLITQITICNDLKIDFGIKIDYQKMAKGIDIVIEDLKNNKTDEGYEIWPIDNEIKEKLPQEARQICDKLMIAYKCFFYWQKRVQLLELLSDGKSSSQNLITIKYFDDKLMGAFIERYKQSNNMGKHEIIDGLFSVQYMFEHRIDNYDMEEAQNDREITVRNLEIFIQKIKEINLTTKSEITKKIGEKSIDTIESRIKEIINLDVC